MDKELRRLERLAIEGGHEEEAAFRYAYDRAHGAGAYWRMRGLQRQEAARQGRRGIVDAVERFIKQQGDDPEELSQEFWNGISELLGPLSDSGEVNQFDGYAPGSGDPDVKVFTADWNTETRWDAEHNQSIVLDDSLSRLGELLESLPNTEIDRSDQVDGCGECYKAIETQPTHYGWTPPYAFVEDVGNVCQGCLQNDPEAYLVDLEENDNSALSPSLGIDPSDYGYQQVPQEYETGWHPGQNDSPTTVRHTLSDQLWMTRYLFAIDSTGQFDTQWSIWIHEEELEGLTERAFDHLEEAVPSDIDMEATGMALAVYYLNAAVIWPDELEEALSEITGQDDSD